MLIAIATGVLLVAFCLLCLWWSRRRIDRLIDRQLAQYSNSRPPLDWGKLLTEDPKVLNRLLEDLFNGS